MIAEGFRSTLISILFAGEKGPRPKVLVLTSAGPGEGKSTIVSNLGIAIAEVGQRVLLIDADMRKPRQHEIFALNNDRGLSTILREKTALNGDKSLGGLIRDTEVPGLFVLTSGPATSAVTSLLYGYHMSELLSYVRTEFDTILIDTPPMLQMPMHVLWAVWRTRSSWSSGQDIRQRTRDWPQHSDSAKTGPAS